MVKTGAQDRGKGLVERCRRVQAKLARPSRGRRGVGREIKSARRLAADRWSYRPMLREPERKLVDCRRAAGLELQLDLAHRHRTVAGFQKAVVESDLDRAGRQVDDALMPVNVGREDRLERVTFEIGAQLVRDEGQRQRDIGSN